MRAHFAAILLGGLVASCATAPTPRSESQVEGYILGPDEGTKAFSHLVKVEPVRGARRLGLGTQRLRAGRSIPLHIHDGEDEVLYILRGRGIGVVGRVERPVVTGSMLYIPQGAWHGVSATEDTEIMWIVAPPKFASYLRESHEAVGASLSEATMREIAAKHEYADTPEFLRRLLAGSRWQLIDSPTYVIFDSSGLRAEVRGHSTAGILEIEGTMPDRLAFAALWTETPASPL